MNAMILKIVSANENMRIQKRGNKKNLIELFKHGKLNQQ